MLKRTWLAVLTALVLAAGAAGSALGDPPGPGSDHPQFGPGKSNLCHPPGQNKDRKPC